MDLTKITLRVIKLNSQIANINIFLYIEKNKKERKGGKYTNLPGVGMLSLYAITFRTSAKCIEVKSAQSIQQHMLYLWNAVQQ